jgi:hypothetical protein
MNNTDRYIVLVNRSNWILFDIRYLATYFVSYTLFPWYVSLHWNVAFYHTWQMSIDSVSIHFNFNWNSATSDIEWSIHVVFSWHILSRENSFLKSISHSYEDTCKHVFVALSSSPRLLLWCFPICIHINQRQQSILSHDVFNVRKEQQQQQQPIEHIENIWHELYYSRLSDYVQECWCSS